VDLDLILENKPYFINVDHNPYYYVKNSSKYRGDTLEIKYSNLKELEYIQYFDTDEDDNIVFWSYKTIRIYYKEPNSERSTYFYPTFWIITKGKKIFGREPFLTPGYPYKEYILQLLNGEDDINFNLLDEEDYLKLSQKEKHIYNLSLFKIGSNQLKFEAINDFCKKLNIQFLINLSNNDFVTMPEKNKFN